MSASAVQPKAFTAICVQPQDSVKQNRIVIDVSETAFRIIMNHRSDLCDAPPTLLYRSFDFKAKLLKMEITGEEQKILETVKKATQGVVDYGSLTTDAAAIVQKYAIPPNKYAKKFWSQVSQPPAPVEFSVNSEEDEPPLPPLPVESSPTKPTCNRAVQVAILVSVLAVVSKVALDSLNS